MESTVLHKYKYWDRVSVMHGSHNDQQVAMITTAITYDNYTQTSEVASDANMLHGV